MNHTVLLHHRSIVATFTFNKFFIQTHISIVETQDKSSENNVEYYLQIIHKCNNNENYIFKCLD